jgi:pimeloyl-ACP methyl ester carboxylesterase
VVAYTGLTKPKLKALAEKKLEEIREQSGILRGERQPADVKDRVVILVDDGLATGSTMTAAVRVLRELGPKKIIVAVPVGSRQAVDAIEKLVDQVVVAHVPEDFWSVGIWYEDFTQVSNNAVRELLKTDLIVSPKGQELDVEIRDEDARLPGKMTLPAHAGAMIVFAHGSGSTHKSPRNLKVAKALEEQGFGTLLFDLLTEDEALDRSNVFDIPLLARRLVAATEYVREHLVLQPLPIGYFGASTGAAAALQAASDDSSIFAVVSRGGRPDMAKDDLDNVKSPTLLIVGGNDVPVIAMNEEALERLDSGEMVIVPKAGHLFEEPGALDKVIEYASGWFNQCLKSEPWKTAPKPVEEVVAEIRELAKPVRSEDDLDALVKSMSGSRVVMLGEATHGTEEFYELRRVISQKLIEDYGFNFIAVEGD